ncbi:MAG: PD-(D/E)XK nuclease family protein [Candidatus Melainabacteria bacterium]|nr:PD-(D/E)XK nuclease family protein [Candidatus Melainabacteria bacterium]
MRVLGDALHLFLAEDDIATKREERLQRASEIATAYEVSGFPAEHFLEAHSRLHTKLDELYPDAVWLREWPVRGRLGDQRTSGSIDFLLELSEGYVIIDHKCFPGSADSWEQQAFSHYLQLDAYATLVSQSTKKNVLATYIHMPIIGLLLELQSAGNWKSEQLPQESEENWLII